jgi:hypothetical protein
MTLRKQHHDRLNACLGENNMDAVISIAQELKVAESGSA